MLRVSGSMTFKFFKKKLCFLSFQRFECHRDSATGIAKVMRLSNADSSTLLTLHRTNPCDIHTSRNSKNTKKSKNSKNSKNTKVMDPETLNIDILAIVSARPGWLALTVCLAEGVAGCARQRRQGNVVKWCLFLPYTSPDPR